MAILHMIWRLAILHMIGQYNGTTVILRGANRYGVLEDSDDDNEVQNVRFANVRE